MGFSFWLLLPACALLAWSPTKGAAVEPPPLPPPFGDVEGGRTANSLPASDRATTDVKELCITVKAVYNNAFADYVKGKGFGPEEAIRIIFEFANGLFRCSGLGGMRIKANPSEIVRGRDPKAKWAASQKKKDWLKDPKVRETTERSTNVDHVAFFSYVEDDLGTSGRAYDGSACRIRSSGSRSSIILVEGSALYTATTFAHELAHVMGATDQLVGKLCTGKRNMMGTADGRNHWSTCTAQELRQYADQGGKCLAVRAPKRCPITTKKGCPDKAAFTAALLAKIGIPIANWAGRSLLGR